VVVTSQPRRTPVPLRLWLVSGDALGERDAKTIILEKRVSKNFGAVPNELSIGCRACIKLCTCRR